ncbi:DUF2799 domain-containing protein [Bdellovibrio bacteriovorus]|uniref:DUF2799 domain-containing protein n=1 Tax=Bdellovibrio bacteriovorus TaxID=959 RepID=UPI0035A66A41
MFRAFLLIACLSLTSCASYFKKKECESTNWFEHGKSVAMEGKWLNSDQLVNECRKVGADIQESQLDKGFKNGVEKYCSNTQAYLTGKNGDLFSRDICEGPQITVLISEHKRGLHDYCHKTNGFPAGTSGKKYKNVCPKELEPAFLVEYRKGRKKYVQSLINIKNDEINELEKKIRWKRSDLFSAENRLRMQQSEMSSLETQKNMLPIEAYQQRSQLDGQISSASTQLNSAKYEVSNLESDIRKIEKERNEKLAEVTALKEELPSLDPN